MSRVFGAVLATIVLALLVLVLFPSLPDPTCASLMVRALPDTLIALPADCGRSRSVIPDAMVSYLERERISRGLSPHGWITCTEVPANGFAFMNDSRWLPSYVPGTYQFRRTVIIVPYTDSAPKGSPVMAEVSRVPWGRYIRQIAGQCTGKYSVWR
jgi:hypothetical protein